ncbi:Crp/Fnr family transcriptional regulator [Amycolatopsis sp. NPDC047767]|uniref:Crp/Fnr family transcriptional regulator n=1 Tax=Amycolatopsis sp. NPDC047767 TaxID=3156765 RepID=UPI003453B00D
MNPAGALPPAERFRSAAGGAVVSPFFAGMPADLVAGLLESGTARHYPRGEVIFQTGEPAPFGYLVVAGKVAMGRTTPTGRERLMTLFLPGDPFGITSVFEGNARVSDAVAISDADVIALPAARLREWVLSDPRIGAAVVRFLSAQVRRINETVGSLLNPDISGRVAAGIVELADRIGVRGPDGIRVRHDLTQEQWAHYVGASRESVNKALKDMARLGVVTLESRELVVHDEERLRRKAGR